MKWAVLNIKKGIKEILYLVGCIKGFFKVIVTVKSSGCIPIGFGVLNDRLYLQPFDLTPLNSSYSKI